MAAPPLRIAAAQYPIERFATLGDYRDKLARWVAEAAGGGAQLLVFPEYGAMEYAGASGDAIAGDLAASLAAVSDALAEMDAAHAELARRHKVHILAASGPSARPGGRYVNAARLFTPAGRMGVQEKLIMTPFERNWGISPGETLRVFETALGRIGIAICYDSEFPLLVRAQAEAGAQIILVPSCTEFRSGYAPRAHGGDGARAGEHLRHRPVAHRRRCALVARRRPQRRGGRHLRPGRSRLLGDRRARRGHAECSRSGSTPTSIWRACSASSRPARCATARIGPRSPAPRRSLPMWKQCRSNCRLG